MDTYYITKESIIEQVFNDLSDDFINKNDVIRAVDCVLNTKENSYILKCSKGGYAINHYFFANKIKKYINKNK